MKSLRKISAMLVICAIIAGLLGGCGKSSGGNKEGSATSSETSSKSPDTTSGDTSNETSIIPKELDTIKIVLFGDESERMKALMEKEYQDTFINEINTKVELIYLPWSEYGTGNKVDLMIAAGQDFDAALVDPTWAANSYSKGYLKDLSGVIDTYLPDYSKNINPIAFDAYRFDSGVYALPVGNKPSAGVFNTVCVRKDIMDAIGMDSISSLEDLTTYAQKAKEQSGLNATYDNALSAYIIRGTSNRNLTDLTTGLWVDQDTQKVVDIASSDEFKAAVELYNNWNSMGLIPKDILTNTVTIPFQANMCSFFRGTCGTTKIENEPGLQQVVPSASTIEFYTSPDKPIYKNSYESTAFQVPVTSNKADRVALFVNLLQKNEELSRLFTYGVEGTDYNLENGKIVKTNTQELFYEWMLYNVNISTPTTSYTDEFMESYKKWDDNALPSVSFGFAIDYDKIKTVKAQIDTVWSEYAYPMAAGLVTYADGIEKLKSELKKANWDTYVAEIQKQLDEYLANKQ